MKLFVILGAINAAVVIALGAFGAHALEQKVTERFLKIYQTGVQYHMYHAMGLIFVGLIAGKLSSLNIIHTAGWFMLVGIVLFSGSLYVLSLTGITKFGMITPIGGLAFIIGWVLVIVAVMRG
ncbi:DUF423 domain-containing protein [Bacillus alkalicellulosilyticus]|uniref:DUF423 domain-containing protein n=1 Tax=Alkalihalobacterium alkalicellulosilyticum TaxID=1912214 RepID=UPI0009980C66|nr:DUF423 domain-containing protein [Bacillus alkalicellulosilyticus]